MQAHPTIFKLFNYTGAGWCGKEGFEENTGENTEKVLESCATCWKQSFNFELEWQNRREHSVPQELEYKMMEKVVFLLHIICMKLKGWGFQRTTKVWTFLSDRQILDILHFHSCPFSCGLFQCQG